MTDKAIRAALLTAKRKDKPSENIADYVADLLRQGRASEVTDDLMAQADPQRLHQHYSSGNTGQPMPMDYASRMERAWQMGMAHKGFHSTLRDVEKFNPVGGFYGHTGTSGISTTDNPNAANRYLDRYGNIDYKGQPFEKNIIPTIANIGNSDVRTGPYPGTSQMGFPLPDGYIPTHEKLGFDSAQFPDSISAAGGVKHSDAENAIRSTETVMSDPTNIRSQFARFDPRLGHLAHLSASTGGAMELARHATAVTRAGGQIAPSKYMPGVPRAVHADGGRVLQKGYSIKVDPDRLGVLARFKGRNVGQMTLSRDRETGKLSAFQMAVHPDHQRKGLMSAMHDAAENAFGPIEPDKTLTDQGFAFWKGYRPDAVSNNLRFHADKLMGQTVKTSSGPGIVNSVGRNGMNADLTDPDKAGRTSWAMARDNEDVLRNVGIDPSTLKYASGGRIGKDYGGALGYVPQYQAQQALHLAVAPIQQQAQQQGPSTLETLASLVGDAQKPAAAAPDAAPAQAPTAGVSASAQAALDALRKGWTGQSFNVVSDYRDPAQNDAVGGAKGSQHLSGNAFDIDTHGWTPEQKLALATEAKKAGFNGFGFYTNNMHFDVGPARTWGPSYHHDSVPDWAQGFASGGKVSDNRLNFISGNHPEVPPVVYHSTKADFDEFYPLSHFGTNDAAHERAGGKKSGHELWGNTQKLRASGHHVMPVHLSMKNPIDVGKEWGWQNDWNMLDQVRDHMLKLSDEPGNERYLKAAEQLHDITGDPSRFQHAVALKCRAADVIRSTGHDGIIYTNDVEDPGNRSFVTLHPEQVKSATGNNGDFDPKNPDITKAEGGTVDDQATPGDRQAGSAAQGLSISGGVRGSQSFLPASLPASGEKDLKGLPTTVKMPTLGRTITAGHDPRIRQVAQDYAKTSGIPYNPPKSYEKVDPARAKRIADAYEAMLHDPSNPLVKSSYDAMLRETMGQYQAMKRAGVKVEFYHDPSDDPYQSNPRLAVEDIRHNNHMFVYPTDAGYGTGDSLPGADENPMLGDSGERWNGKPVLFNDLFRAVHDYFGHAKEGVGFRADGEENAWRQHAAMFSPLARIALGTETRGQNSWLNYGPHGDKNRTAKTEDTVFADQKLGVLPPWVHHEGAEDFIPPHEREAMTAIYRAHGKSDGGSTGSRFPVWSRSGFKPEDFSKALSSSPSASTLTQYDPQEVRQMLGTGKFEGYKLAGHDAYFGIKNGADYGDDYGFEHPALTNHEKALVGVVNNDKNARGVGDSLMKAAIKHGVTALDAFAVPSDKHPKGFLPDFYSKYGFKELGRIPFDPKYVTPEQFADMKKSWAAAGWDEKRHPLPDVTIMKRANGGFVQGQHKITEKFHNGGAARLMKARKVNPVSAALAMTRRFTKDGTGAIMALKPKGN